MAIAGNGMKAFGRDVGRNTEGRRNHIDSYQYTGEDGSRRTRIRFNVKGDKAKVLVWAEVRDTTLLTIMIDVSYLHFLVCLVPAKLFVCYPSLRTNCDIII